MNNLFVYDIEQFKNYFCIGFMNVETKQIVRFRIFYSQTKQINDLEDLCNFIRYLKQNKCILIGFNNLGYDYPVLHDIINCTLLIQNSKSLVNYYTCEVKDLIRILYAKSQEIVNAISFNEMFTKTIHESKHIISQIDLYTIWHFNNAAKRTSLKALEIAMNLPIVEDLPFKYDAIIEEKDIEKVELYNDNDLYATYEFYKITIGDCSNILYKGQNKLQLRKDINEKFGISVTNKSDVSIGKEIVISTIANKMNKEIKELRGLKTVRTEIIVKDLIFDFYKFDNNNIKNVYQYYKNLILTEESMKKKTNKSKKDEKSIIINNVKIHYGLGGLHSACESGLYKEDDNYEILDIDVGAFYPSIVSKWGLQYNIYPEHLGYIFVEAVDFILKERKKYPKNSSINLALKLAANGGVFGASKDEYSPTFDSRVTYIITINGQLMILYLIDKIIKEIPNINILQVNTDGATFLIEKKVKSKILEICKIWETISKMTLEYNNYKKMWIRDVNNYIALSNEGKLKLKGCYEIDKEIHKNHSMRIVRIAAKEFLMNNIPIETTIKNHTNIFDFCKRFKATAGWNVEYHHIQNGEKVINNLSKNVRYYVSNKGGGLYKKKMTEIEKKKDIINTIWQQGFLFENNEDDDVETKKFKSSFIGIEAGTNIVPYNIHKEKDIKEYHLNYQYYIDQCKDLIKYYVYKQQRLF